MSINKDKADMGNSFKKIKNLRENTAKHAAKCTFASKLSDSEKYRDTSQ